ncbi:hypothetical protein HJFPF1_11134 [Paramyrothecium foliicola]|nr:hypothetical protein HJFPF1_11134 [Paramyrothecium foliicola]
MAAMGQQPIRAASSQTDSSSAAASHNLKPTVSAADANDEASIKQIIADLRAMGERLSTATKQQIENLKTRGPEATGPDPAAQRHWTATQAAKEASSPIVKEEEKEQKLQEKQSQEDAVNHQAHTPDEKPKAA